MRRRHREVQEERLPRRLRPLMNHIDRFVRQRRKHLRHLKTLRSHTRAPEYATRLLAPRIINRRRLHHMVILKVHIRSHVQRSRNPEVVVEPVVHWPRPQRLRKVRRRIVSQTQMPLAYTSRVITLLLEHPRHRKPTFFNQIRRVAIQHALLQPRPPRIPSCQNAVPARCAHRRRSMHVRKPHPLPRESIRHRRRYRRVCVINIQITPPKIVSKDVNHARLLRPTLGRRRDPHRKTATPPPATQPGHPGPSRFATNSPPLGTRSCRGVNFTHAKNAWGVEDAHRHLVRHRIQHIVHADLCPHHRKPRRIPRIVQKFPRIPQVRVQR